jgi:Holliday junction resolvase RusA-like endonuclease
MYDSKIRRRIPTGGKILSKEGELCKEQIQLQANKQLGEQTWDYSWTENKNNFLYQDAVIYFSRRGRDDNNIYKLLNDSLEKIVYDNDSRVLVRTQKILYDTKNPRIELTLTPVDYVGVFKDNEAAKKFELKCSDGNGKMCSRYLNGRCSILTDLLAGSIREEVENINNPVCSKFKQKK